MSDGLWVLIDVLFLSSFVVNLYWRAQIVFKANYKFFRTILTVILSVWLVASMQPSWAYIIMVASFITINLMQGSGGIGPKWIVTNGLLSNAVSYQKVTHVTLAKLQVTPDRSYVVAIFTINDHQEVNMVFRAALSELEEYLQSLLPQHTEIEVTDL